MISVIQSWEVSWQSNSQVEGNINCHRPCNDFLDSSQIRINQFRVNWKQLHLTGVGKESQSCSWEYVPIETSISHDIGWIILVTSDVWWEFNYHDYSCVDESDDGCETYVPETTHIFDKRHGKENNQSCDTSLDCSELNAIHKVSSLWCQLSYHKLQ